MKREFRTLADPETVQETIASLDLGGSTEPVPLDEAHGRVLAERVDAAIDVPGFDRAAMDGYAVRASDTVGADERDPAVLDLVGEVHAGENPSVSVPAGSCVEISTGAVIPEGADSVVVVERTTSEAETVEIHTAVAPGENIMFAGTDIAAGARGLGAGTRLTPREIGLLSALGLKQVPVRSRPRVGILSTGDELVPPGEELNSARGEIYDVNTTTIAAGVEAAGGEAVVYPHVGDDFAAMEQMLRAAADDCDLVLSSGSTSASAVDVIYRVIEERGELLLHGAAIKPGKPMLVGRIDSTGDADRSAYIGLPGYPISAMTIFRVFVAPAIRAAAGHPEPATATVAATLAVEQRHDVGRRRLLSVGLVEDGAGDTLAYPVDKGSGATTTLADADGVIEIPATTDYLSAGEAVEVSLFSPDIQPPALLAVGEDDPLFSNLLDELSTPRYLPIGTRDGLRRLRDGVPDVAVVAGPTSRTVEAAELGSWHREWGLVVPSGNPAGVDSLAVLGDSELRFTNRRRQSGLRSSLDAAIESLADDRGISTQQLTDSIVGFTETTAGAESPARRVADGRADVGLGLRATAEKLGLDFVSCGEQHVRLLGNPDRLAKPAVETLAAVVDSLEEHSLAGYRAAAATPE